MKKLLLTALMLIGFISLVHARPAKERLATPTFRNDGNRRAFYKVNVGSASSTGQPWPVDEDADRWMFIQNYSSYTVAYATFSGFNPAVDAFQVMVPSSTYSDFVTGTSFYMRALAGSTTVSLQIQRQYNTK